ncbi:MAG TPA: hypothetical protein VLE73_03875 [Candidatus Saccharimonadales bacterium]|nr:hypothetical protein [Candidatus Saccharimonadales bacterium]
MQKGSEVIANVAYDQNVTNDDVRGLSDRLTSAGIDPGHIHDVTHYLNLPGGLMDGRTESVQLWHSPAPPRVHIAVGALVAKAPAKDIWHTVLSGREDNRAVGVYRNQAAVNQDNKKAEDMPGFPSNDTVGHFTQHYSGFNAREVLTALDQYVTAIEQAQQA